jgi:hypothetical protein
MYLLFCFKNNSCAFFFFTSDFTNVQSATKLCDQTKDFQFLWQQVKGFVIQTLQKNCVWLRARYIMMLYYLKPTVVYALSEELCFFSTGYFPCLCIKLILLRWCNLQARLISNIQVLSYVIRLKLKEKNGLGNTFVELFYFYILDVGLLHKEISFPLGNHVYFSLCLDTNWYLQYLHYRFISV